MVHAARVAFAWKLASLGIPTVLTHLGFVGDVGIADVGAPFDSPGHFDAVFADYARSVVPIALFERRIECGLAPMWLLVRSRAVLQASAGHDAVTLSA